MIAFLKGNLQEIDDEGIILDVGGVGYRVFLSKRALSVLPPLGNPIEIRIHTVVREDALNLFGFLSPDEETVFKKLLSVSGIGPKVGLGILSHLAAHEIAEAIYQENLIKLTSIPGIGKKTAERMIVELKDKMLAVAKLGSHESTRSSEQNTHWQEAISAFTNLGYSRTEAEKVLASIEGAKHLSLPKLVKEGLKRLSY